MCVYYMCNAYARVRKFPRRSRDFQTSPWWEMPPFIILETSFFRSCPQGGVVGFHPLYERLLAVAIAVRGWVPFEVLANECRANGSGSHFFQPRHAYLINIVACLKM